MKRLTPSFLLAILIAASPRVAVAQSMEEDKASARQEAIEKYQQLTDPEKLLEKKKKLTEKQKPPFEFFRSQIAPFDTLPFVKANHWNTISLEMRANLADYTGQLQSAPVRLLDMSHEMVFLREARLVKEQDGKLGMQIMLPQVQKELTLELTQEGAIRGDAAWQASLLRLEPHQMIIPVLSPDPQAYLGITKMQAMLPFAGDKDPQSIEKQRYYRLVQPLNPDKPSLLSSHPLTWTAISHVIWDGYNPELLNVGQQQALIDWIHWGGQLIIVGGAGPSLTALQDSFLKDFLPATPSGKNVLLKPPDLEALALQYAPPVTKGEWEQQIEGNPAVPQGSEPPRYKEPVPIPLPANKSIFLTGLTPEEGATPIPLNDPGRNLLGVEWRVGRGRVLILAVKITDPNLLKWEGLDTLVRTVVLRRPEEGKWLSGQRAFPMLSARELSAVRFLGRDMGSAGVADPNAPTPLSKDDIVPPLDPVGAWIDTAELPKKSRLSLEKASGITIPGSDFVLKVVLSYAIALVPLNWFICRFVLRRRELAWVVAPVLALGFAIAVERAAAYDMGFDSACDEIDVLELQGRFPRGHLSRFAALYSTGRVRYEIAYPNNPTALALPMNMERGLRGDEVVQSVFRSTPAPTLSGFPVQPRSLAMFRAEEMVNLPGGIEFVTDPSGVRKLVNETGFDLQDAVVVRVGTNEWYALGTVRKGTASVLKNRVSPMKPPTPDEGEPDLLTLSKDKSKLSPSQWFQELLRRYQFAGPEVDGEWRLVAWTDRPHPGQDIRPKVDRHRGFRLVVAHLTYGGMASANSAVAGRPAPPDTPKTIGNPDRPETALR